MTTVEVSSSRVHKFEKNGWSGLYLLASRSINCSKKDGPEEASSDSDQ